MNTELSQQIDRLRTLPFTELQREHLIVFGKRSPSRDPQQVFRRLAWHLQATAEGGLSPRARARAAELAPGDDLRLQAICTPPGPAADSAADGKDARLPQPGTVLVREFRGQRITVRILANGFDYDGCFYRSLSAIAEKATGTSWNGYQFFGLTRGARGGRDRS
jgi:hypothetical protein